jgi:hypothetical protein
MGGVWAFLISLAASWFLVVPSAVAIWRRCCKKHGEIRGGEISLDALPVQFGEVAIWPSCWEEVDTIQSIQAHTNGHPLQRAMFMEFLDDRTTHYLDRQYMLGMALQRNTG